MIRIGNIRIGICNDKWNWKKCILPHAYSSDKHYKHNYYKYYYRWFNIYWYKPRRCDICKKYIGDNGGILIRNEKEKAVYVICMKCNKKYRHLFYF